MELTDKILVTSCKIGAIILICICMGLLTKIKNDDKEEK